MRARLGRLPLLLVGVVLLATAGCTPLHDDAIEITAIFDDSAGLFVGNDVGILGVPVGRVTSITPSGSVVKVGLEVDRDDVPATAGAVVVARSVATDRYVELTPAFAKGPRMADGATIPLKRTRTPVEFDEVLASLRDFSKGLRGPDGKATSVRRLLSAGATALDGRGDDLNATLHQLATATAGLSEHRDDIVGSIDSLAELTRTLADNKAVVDQFAQSVSDATDLFADERENFGRALTALSRALGTLATFVKENRAQLGDSVTGLTRVTNNLLQHEDQLAESLQVLPLTFENIGRAVGEDGRLHVKLPLQSLSPEQRLTDPLCEALPNDLCDSLGTDPDLGDLLGRLVGATS